MLDEELINKQIKELDAQYEQALRQLAGLASTIRDLKKYAGHLINTGDFSVKPQRMSNEAWRGRASELVKELIRVDKKTYPTFSGSISSRISVAFSGDVMPTISFLHCSFASNA